MWLVPQGSFLVCSKSSTARYPKAVWQEFQCSMNSTAQCTKAVQHHVAQFLPPTAPRQCGSVHQHLKLPLPRSNAAVCHKTCTTCCPKVVCLYLATFGGGSNATLTSGSVVACKRTFTAHCPKSIRLCAARVPLPTARKRCSSMQQELQCPLTEGSVAACGKSSIANSLPAVWHFASRVSLRTRHEFHCPLTTGTAAF